MRVAIETLRETHQLGPDTREWVVSTPRAGGFGAVHQRVVGFTEARTGYGFVRHNPPFAALVVTESGEGLAAVDGAWVPCPAGHAYLMPAHSRCAYHIRPGHAWRLHWAVYFEPARLPGLEPGTPPRLVACDAAGLRHAIEGFCREHSGRAEPAALALWGDLTDHLVRRLVAPDRSDERLERLWTVVREDLGAPWDMPRLARAAGMSEENLRRLCLRHLGRPPGAHLTHLRMQAAAGLLLHTGEKLEAVATRLGYADAFGFGTAFKRTMGVAPGAYRARARAAR